MTRYLSLDELIYINEQMPSISAIHKYLQGVQRVREMRLLDSAVHRPQQSAFGADAYPSLSEKAAVLLHAIARNHPFADGNKRTATLGMLFMLETNGVQMTWDANEALERIVALAEGHTEVSEFSAWLEALPQRQLPPRLEPDEAQDSAHIARLISAHQWLLNELSRR